MDFELALRRPIETARLTGDSKWCFTFLVNALIRSSRAETRDASFRRLSLINFDYKETIAVELRDSLRAQSSYQASKLKSHGKNAGISLDRYRNRRAWISQFVGQPPKRHVAISVKSFDNIACA